MTPGEGEGGPTRAATRAVAAIVFALCLALFAWRAAPGVTFEDSGELAAATVTGGVPHPPGYPLQMIAGRVWWGAASLLGAEDPARALNLFSAACAAGAAALLAAFVARAGGRPGAAVAAGLLVALSPTFAAQAVVTEVYALAALAQAALVLAALTLRRPLVPAALLFGLALAAHQGSALLAPLVLVAFLRERRDPGVAEVAKATGARGARRLGLAALALVLGLAPYLYVPLAAAGDPPVNWGEATTLERLADHLLRAQYDLGVEQPIEPRLAFLAEQLAGQWPLALAAGVACVVLFRRRVPGHALGAVVLALVVTALGLFASVHFAVEEIDARWRLAGSYVPLVLLAAAVVGLGASGAERALRERVPSAAAAGLVPVAFVLLAVPFGPRTLATAVDQRGAHWAESYAREVLEACPRDAVLVVNKQGYSDVLYFPLLYLSVARGVRPDVLLVNRDLLPAAWFREQLARREPELARACARLSARFAESPERTRDPVARRVLTATFFADLYDDGGRPVVFTTAPGERLRHGRAVVPGPVLWHVLEPGQPVPVSDAPPASAWLPPVDPERGDPDPWLAAVRRFARERDAARARLLREAGEPAAAERLAPGDG